jgi:hypothetical protein
MPNVVWQPQQYQPPDGVAAVLPVGRRMSQGTLSETRRWPMCRFSPCSDFRSELASWSNPPVISRLAWVLGIPAITAASSSGWLSAAR